MDKFLVFDFDGTIVDSRELVIRIYNEIAERKNYKSIEKPDIEALSKVSIAERCKTLDVPVYQIPSIALELGKRYAKELSTLKIRDGMKALLHNLKSQGFGLGILSSNQKSTILQVLEANQIDVFDVIHSEKNLFGKQHAISKLIKKLNLGIDNVLYVGDEVRDILSCQKVNMKIVAVTWGYDSAYFLQENNPDYIANEPEEITSIVNKHFQ